MSQSKSNTNAILDMEKDTLDESLVIPLDGYSDESEERGKKRFYGFKLGDVNLLIDPAVRSEVFSDLEITAVPLMPEYLVGLSSIRGSLIPVYDLNNKLNLKSNDTNSENKRILVLDDDENMAGIQIEDMVVSHQFDEQDLQDDVQSEVDSINKFLTYSYRYEGQNYFGFNHIKLFSSQ